MAHPMIHAESSAKKFGGQASDYIMLHEWFDATKAWCPSMAHRSMRHHSEGIFELAEKFGETIVNSDGKTVYTRYVGEQHVIEDLGFIPTASDWLECMDMDLWMMARSKKIDKRAGKKYIDKLPKSLEETNENQ